jgi:hypothetical protein
MICFSVVKVKLNITQNYSMVRDYPLQDHALATKNLPGTLTLSY